MGTHPQLILLPRQRSLTSTADKSIAVSFIDDCWWRIGIQYLLSPFDILMPMAAHGNRSIDVIRRAYSSKA